MKKQVLASMKVRAEYERQLNSTMDKTEDISTIHQPTNQRDTSNNVDSSFDIYYTSTPIISPLRPSSSSEITNNEQSILMIRNIHYFMSSLKNPANFPENIRNAIQVYQNSLEPFNSNSNNSTSSCTVTDKDHVGVVLDKSGINNTGAALTQANDVSNESQLPVNKSNRVIILENTLITSGNNEKVDKPNEKQSNPPSLSNEPNVTKTTFIFSNETTTVNNADNQIKNPEEARIVNKVPGDKVDLPNVSEENTQLIVKPNSKPDSISNKGNDITDDVTNVSNNRDEPAMNKLPKKVLDRRKRRIATINKCQDRRTIQKDHQYKDVLQKFAELKDKEIKHYSNIEFILKDFLETNKKQNVMLSQLIQSNTKTVELYERFLNNVSPQQPTETNKVEKVIKTKTPKKRVQIQEPVYNTPKKKRVEVPKTSTQTQCNEDDINKSLKPKVNRRKSIDERQKRQKVHYEEYEITGNSTPKTKLTFRRKSIDGVKAASVFKRRYDRSSYCGQRKRDDPDDDAFEDTPKINKTAKSQDVKAEDELLFKRLEDLKAKNTLSMGGLPPEYDQHDTRWTLKHRHKTPALTELTKDSNVYIERIKLEECLRLAKNNCRALVRSLVREIFTYNALITCDVPGIKKESGKPRLDKWALLVILDYVREKGLRHEWHSYEEEDILNSIRYMMYHLKKKAFLTDLDEKLNKPLSQNRRISCNQYNYE